MMNSLRYHVKLCFMLVICSLFFQEEEEDSLEDSPPSTPLNKKSTNRYNLIWKYFREGGSLRIVMLSFLGFIISQVGRTVAQYWLTVVTESAKVSNGTEINHLNMNISDCLRKGCHDQFFNLTETEISNKGWTHQFDIMTSMTIYAYLIGTSLTVIGIHHIFFYAMCMKSSINIHNGMARSVLKAPMHFFDRNPIGNNLQSSFIILLYIVIM